MLVIFLSQSQKMQKFKSDTCWYSDPANNLRGFLFKLRSFQMLKTVFCIYEYTVHIVLLLVAAVHRENVTVR